MLKYEATKDCVGIKANSGKFHQDFTLFEKPDIFVYLRRRFTVIIPRSYLVDQSFDTCLFIAHWESPRKIVFVNLLFVAITIKE